MQLCQYVETLLSNRHTSNGIPRSNSIFGVSIFVCIDRYIGTASKLKKVKERFLNVFDGVSFVIIYG